MKKIISLVLMVAMLFSVSAFAEEEFMLHNGTKFGMSRDEVINQEAQNDFNLLSRSNILEGHGIVANQSNTGITYYFSSNDNLLYCMSYAFADTDSYVAIENSLLNKYGETSYSSITGFAFPKVEGFSPSVGFVTSEGTTREKQFKRDRYSHRLVQISDTDYVIIEHYTYSTYSPHTSTYSSNGWHGLLYKLVNAETAQLIFDSIETANDDL